MKPTPSETTKTLEIPPSLSLSAGERKGLLGLARRALEKFLAEGIRIDPWQGSIPVPDAWRRPAAVFVTLRGRNNGALRGCRGAARARHPLAEAVVAEAIASATEDHRFPALTVAELTEISIQISVLTPLKPIQPDQVVPGRHGLLLAAGNRSGLLLPQVAESNKLDQAGFLQALCQKAGLAPELLTHPRTRLFAFEAEVWGEKSSLD